MNKDTLIEEIEKGKQLFDFLIDELGEDDLVKPGVCGEWSVKDIVVHIVVHEQRMLKWMVETLQGGTPVEYQPYDSPEEQLDALNRQIYLENFNRSWNDVLKDWEAIHVKTLEWIRSVDEEALFDPGRFHLRNGEPLWVVVAAITYAHCDEHGWDIRGRMGKEQ